MGPSESVGNELDLSSLTPGMVGQIVEYSTARDIWASLNDEYESPSIATVMSLNSQLQRIKKLDIPLSEYLSRLKFVFDKFATIGEPLSYRDKLTRILEGLPEEYDNFVTSIHNRSDRPSLQEVHSLLHTYEYRLSQRSVDQNLNFPQANVTTYLGNKKNQKNHYQHYPKQPQMPNSFPYIKPPYIITLCTLAQIASQVYWANTPIPLLFFSLVNQVTITPYLNVKFVANQVILPLMAITGQT